MMTGTVCSGHVGRCATGAQRSRSTTGGSADSSASDGRAANDGDSGGAFGLAARLLDENVVGGFEAKSAYGSLLFRGVSR